MSVNRHLVSDIRDRGAGMLAHVWMHDLSSVTKDVPPAILAERAILTSRDEVEGDIEERMLVGYTSEDALKSALVRCKHMPRSTRKVPVAIAVKVAADAGMEGVMVVGHNGNCMGRIYKKWNTG